MTEPDERPLAPLQAILDAQGYVIIGNFKELRIGEIVAGRRSGGRLYQGVDITAVVIGSASLTEWDLQCRRFNMPYNDQHPDLGAAFFYKVIAE